MIQWAAQEEGTADWNVTPLRGQEISGPSIRYGLDAEDVDGRCEAVGVQDFTEIVEVK